MRLPNPEMETGIKKVRENWRPSRKVRAFTSGQGEAGNWRPTSTVAAEELWKGRKDAEEEVAEEGGGEAREVGPVGNSGSRS